MRLIVPVLLNILLVVLMYTLKKRGKFAKLSYIKSQIIIGICFGAVSCFASSFGVEANGVMINVRDAAPISSGLIFGSLSGIIAGFMGGLYRIISTIWDPKLYTMVACSISTALAGITAGVLRHYMFDNKRATITYAIGITIVIEVFHMLMIFITNFNDANYAFEIVRKCTILMVVANSIAVGMSILIVSILSKDFKFKREKKEKGIADTFQIWLFISIVIAFIVTSVFTYNLQSGMNNKYIQDMFTVTMTDTGKDIQEQSNGYMLEILEDVKERYLLLNDDDLTKLLKTDDYEIKEINIISSEGIIINSTAPRANIDFDMYSSTQSKEFMDSIKEFGTIVQSYGLNAYSYYRKYAGVTLDDGSILQIGYDAEQFHTKLDEFVILATKNRHIGSNGFIAVCDEKFNLVINNEYNGKHISHIGITPNEEMLAKKDATQIYQTNIINQNTNYNEEYIYVFAFCEGYCIIAALPQKEAMLMRDASMYLSLFMQVLIFSVLFVLIFYLIKKIIVNNLHIVNNKLAEITGGNLDVEVDVRASEEFSSLSDDINTTVSTLKRYIADAAARIDKELEYAKQIQLSALPINFPENVDYNINASMNAAKEVGGDFYDFYILDENHVAILIADVSGKGIPAAMFMMTAKTIIKDLAESGLEVNEIFTKANQKLCENNESNMFVTAWMGIIDLETGTLQYSNAGHNPPLILKENGEFEYLRSKAGFILAGMDGIRYRKNELSLSKGDRIFLYTDGVTEATNVDKELYGEERLLNYLNNNKDTSSKEILNKIKENIDEFAGSEPQADDITMLIFDYNKTKDIRIEQEFNAVKEELPNIITLLETELDKYGASLKTTTQLTVAVEEIFINIANYAYGDNQGICKFSLNYKENLRELTITFEDNGKPFNPLAKEDPDVTLSAEDRQIGGLGIYIVKKTMDEVTYSYENDKNILKLKKVI